MMRWIVGDHEHQLMRLPTRLSFHEYTHVGGLNVNTKIRLAMLNQLQYDKWIESVAPYYYDKQAPNIKG